MAWWWVAVLAVVAGRCEGWWFGGADSWELCQICSCPKDVQAARVHGVDCRDANLTVLNDMLVIPAPYHRVDFSKNHIAKLSSFTFVESPTMTAIDLSANKIYSIEKETFSKFPNLQKLSLRNNKLSSLPNETFAGLARLTHLDLSYNQLTSLECALLKPLLSLEVLSVAFNQDLILHDPFNHSFVNLTNLDLSGLGLKELPEYLFSKDLEKLEVLSLAYNEFTNVPKGLVSLNESLNTLDFSANPVEVLTPYAFFGLRRVQTLYLRQMLKLRAIEDYAFGDLTNLETIEITYIPRITELSGKAFYTYPTNPPAASLPHLPHHILPDRPLPQAFQHVKKVDTAFQYRTIPVQDFTFSFSILATLPETLLDWDELRYVSLRYNHFMCDCNMAWIKNSSLLQLVGDDMVCSQPDRLRGHRVNKVMASEFVCGRKALTEHKSFEYLLLLMLLGTCASLGTVALLVYMKRGWLFRPPDNPYSRVTSTRTTITVTDELEWDNKDLAGTSTA